jgi:hypothetical protein
MPIQGFVRLRKHQFGRQQQFGTMVPATRAYPFTGVPANERNWTDPEIDAGSLDPTAPPYPDAPDLTADLTANALCYNDLPLIHSAFFGDEVAPTGGGDAQTWEYHPASESVDPRDVFTYEFGDDVLTDWFQNGDGILESFDITGPEGLGVLTASMGWRFGSLQNTGSTDHPAITASGEEVPTPGLNVDTRGVMIYLKDGGIWIASDPADLFEDATQIKDALHTFTLHGDQQLDLKRFANADQKFDIDAYGPGARNITLEATYAKTADTVGMGSESDAWLSDIAVDRYIGLEFTSTELAQSPSTFYSWQVVMPMRYYTRVEGEVDGNTVIVLTAHAFFDPEAVDSGDVGFGGVYEATIVNTLTESELGIAGS